MHGINSHCSLCHGAAQKTARCTKKVSPVFLQDKPQFFSKSLLPFLTPVNKEKIRSVRHTGLKALVFSYKIG